MLLGAVTRKLAKKYIKEPKDKVETDEAGQSGMDVGAVYKELIDATQVA